MSAYFPQACLKLRILPEDFELVSDASKQKPQEITVVARDITVNVNDHKTADSFTAEIDFKNFPFDPRSCRYVGVVIYMQDMKQLYHDDGSLNTIQPTTDNVIFSGFVDEQTVTFDDSKRTVKFEGRDFTALLIDQKYEEKVPLFLNSPLDVQINAFLSTFKATKEITIENRTGTFDPIEKKWSNKELPTLGKFFPDFGSPQSGHRNTGTHESYWEIIQDLVNRAGLICFIHLDKLVITTPRNLYNPDLDIKFVYGINLKHLTYKRKLGRFKNFNILVRSRSEKQVLEAKIPEEATPAWCKDFGIPRAAAMVPVLKPNGSLDNTQQKPAPYIAFPIPNIEDKDQLITIGQSVYEDYSRQQLEGSFETMEMVCHSGIDQNDKNWKEFDLTQLDIGQSMAIEITSDDLDKITRFKEVTERTNYLIARGYEPTVAGIFASTMGKFSPRFYLKSYSLTLNQDSGFKLRVEFINLIELTYRGL